ncbi:hypothetical protein [Mangrovicoccus ximenensis]|uniref:hypothetical protein n=1 Tax=Mangrovicoccus ximenensis TaxID=1911570 RepID=UPI001F26AA4D|nr:hypothetical protein [Mangrovicoccus ximenensis]
MISTAPVPQAMRSPPSRAPGTDSSVAAAGPEQRVNAFTAGEQHEAHVARLADGGTVVTWRSVSQDTPDGGFGVFAQRYDASGAKAGGAFQVNTLAEGSQYNPMAAGLETGGFVIAWRDDNAASDGSGVSVQAQIFDAAGQPAGEAFTVNTETASSQLHPALVQIPGGFAVAWASAGQDGSGYGTYMARFANDGTRISPEQQVSQDTQNDQYLPRIAGFADGGTVTVWTSNAAAAGQGDGSGWSIWARVHAPLGGAGAGAPETVQIAVNATTSGSQYRPDVATFADGRFVTVWEDQSGNDGSGYGVFARIMNRDGSPAGDEFRVNGVTAGQQSDPKVAVLEDGRFVVVWYDASASEPGGNGQSIQGQLYGSDGSRIDGPFLVNEASGLTQNGPEIAALPGGGFRVVWSSNGQDGSGYGVYARDFGTGGAAPLSAPPVLAGVSDAAFAESGVNAGLVLLAPALSLSDPDTAPSAAASCGSNG